MTESALIVGFMLALSFVGIGCSAKPQQTAGTVAVASPAAPDSRNIGHHSKRPHRLAGGRPQIRVAESRRRALKTGVARLGTSEVESSRLSGRETPA